MNELLVFVLVCRVCSASSGNVFFKYVTCCGGETRGSSGAHPASYTMGTGGLFPGGKVAGA
jgi:hypothetical protein